MAGLIPGHFAFNENGFYLCPRVPVKRQIRPAKCGNLALLRVQSRARVSAQIASRRPMAFVYLDPSLLIQ